MIKLHRKILIQNNCIITVSIYIYIYIEREREREYIYRNKIHIHKIHTINYFEKDAANIEILSI